MAWLALLTSGESEPGRTPPGLVPVGGVSILERQVRAMRAAGAAGQLLLAPALPAAAAERLALCGDVIRLDTADALARALADEPRDLILLAPGLIAGPAFPAALASGGPAIACFEDAPGARPPAGAERLDSASLWAGCARLPASLVADVAARLGDWALVPTLVRSGIEAGLPRLAVPAPDGSPARLWLLPGDAAVAEAETALLEASRPAPGGLVARHLHIAIEAALARLLLPRGVPPLAAALAAPLLLAGAVALAGAGAPGWSLLPLLAAGPLAGLGRRLAVAQGQAPPPAVLDSVLAVLGAAWLVALAAILAPALGLAAVLAAGATLLLLGATLASHRAWRRVTGTALVHRTPTDRRLALLLADPWHLAWLAAVLGLAAGWASALLGVAAAAALAFAVWHWRLLAGLVEGWSVAPEGSPPA